MQSELAAFLEAVIDGDVLAASDLPKPTEGQRKAPGIPRGNAVTPSEQMTFEDS